MEMLQEYRYRFVQFWRRSLTFRMVSSFVAFALTALLIVLPLRAQQPVVLSILIPAPDVKPFPPVIAEFERQNPGVKINIVEGPNASNLVEDLYSSAFLLGDSPYDLLNMDITWVPKFAAAGWLQDISDILPQAEFAKFLQGDIEGGRYKGKLYRLPYRTDVGMLYYRSDLLQQAGLKPPETFQDLLQASKTIQGKNAAQWGYVWQGRQYEGLSAMFTEVLQGNGGFWINPQTNEVGLDRPESIDTVKFLLSTIQQGISPPGVNTYIEEDARRLFQSGNTLFMRNWPYAWDLLNGKESPVQGKVGIKPMIRAADARSGACQGGWGLGISSTTRHPQEARKVVQFFTSPEIQKQLSIAGAYLPTRRDLYSDRELLQRYEYFPLILKILENPALRPPIAQYAQASDILQRYLNATLSGQLSAEDAMRSAARETRTLLGA
ncbi:MAG: ABC transporter substrate-binding protein [Plectolyngbya sp. WJT66-NPBG17]|nr:ABC transporter substrate-binding protein [Plectolyngbya sp. WJT66-NPBG17]